MKDKIITYGKEYVSNFKQNPLSATAILTMQIIFILGWGTFYMFLCERDAARNKSSEAAEVTIKKRESHR